jgi:hypothetical protein
MNPIFILAYYCLFTNLAFPQSGSVRKYTISGYMADLSSEEKLIGANVIDLKSGLGGVTNNFGFFSLTLPADSVALRFSYIGYQSTQMDFF